MGREGKQEGIGERKVVSRGGTVARMGRSTRGRRSPPLQVRGHWETPSPGDKGGDVRLESKKKREGPGEGKPSRELARIWRLRITEIRRRQRKEERRRIRHRSTPKKNGKRSLQALAGQKTGRDPTWGEEKARAICFIPSKV